MAAPRKPRDYISPSDLTFLYGECPKCFWLKYRHGISTPGFMPLVGPMSAFQEGLYAGQPSSKLSPLLPSGRIARAGDWVESDYIRIGAVTSRWKIKGKYDIVVEYDSGGLGLVDCKVTTSDMDQSKVDHYRPQLEAYCYAMEHPLSGEAESVRTAGLMMWRIVGAGEPTPGNYTFVTEPAYLDCPRDPDLFTALIEKVIDLIEGPEPESGEKCGNCRFVRNRNGVGA